MRIEQGEAVPVTTTYLELSAATFRPAWSDDGAVQVIGLGEPLPSFYRWLYGEVGRDYLWVDRLAWSEELLLAYLTGEAVSVDVLYYRGTPAGYVELNRTSDEPGTEVAYFGLLAQFQGRGLGKHLLSYGVRRALAEGVGRVWLHTCSLDGPHALANYQARGFRAYKTVEGVQMVPSALVRG